MDILSKIDRFYKNYKYEKGIIGCTYSHRNIYYFCVKKTDAPRIIVQYSIHAREYITAYLALKHIKDFLKEKSRGTVYFIPCLNPDGVQIALHKNPLYKANGRKVDLNVNFDAKWGTGAFNKTTPDDENYIGQYPFSERETVAIRDFTYKIKPHGTISYHAKGEEIYYEFFQTERDRKRDLKIAEAIAKETGYKIKSTVGSVGGYKDWCIEKLKIPSLTIEVGNDGLSHPIGQESLGDIYKKNKGVIKVFTEELWKLSL
ncbi:MAG: hypothetical protein IJR66_04160 [Clostridia bacterium]|nr:hypothetical protein [Clostridia bacterium]